MAITNLTDMTDEQKLRMAYRRAMKGTKVEVLKPETRYAVVLLELHSAVTEGDYGTLGTDIQAVTGVQDIQLLFDRVTPATVDLPVASDLVIPDEEVPENPPQVIPRETREKMAVDVNLNLTAIQTP